MQIQVIIDKHSKMHASKSWLVLVFPLLSWESGMSNNILTNRWEGWSKTYANVNYVWHSIENCSDTGDTWQCILIIVVKVSPVPG